jgi:hypothetical protein
MPSYKPNETLGHDRSILPSNDDSRAMPHNQEAITRWVAETRRDSPWSPLSSYQETTDAIDGLEKALDNIGLTVQNYDTELG